MNIRWKNGQKKLKKILCLLSALCLLTFISAVPISATSAIDTTEPTENPYTSSTIDTGVDNGDTENPDNFELNISSNAGSTSLSSTLQIVIALTILSIAPSILLMVTSFTRILVVLHFVRAALGTQTTPPNQVLIGLALFLTFFIMAPVITEVNENAVQPLTRGEITQDEAMEAGMKPIRTFMFSQTNEKDIKLFLEIADVSLEEIHTEEDIPTTTLIPAFMISELRKGFVMGFMIYLPFLVIDMVVASTLMSMGMMMLPPTTISMPFKILLFIMADGWNLVVGELVKTFY